MLLGTLILLIAPVPWCFGEALSMFAHTMKEPLHVPCSSQNRCGNVL